MKLKKIQVQYFKYTYSLNKQDNFFIRTFDSAEEALNSLAIIQSPVPKEITNFSDSKTQLIYWNKGFDYIKEQLSDLNKFFDDRFDYSPCQSNCYRLTGKLDDCYYGVYITATRDISK